MIVANHRNSSHRTPEEYDSFLFKKYGYGLYVFCYVLAHLIRESNPRYSVAPEYLAPLLREGRDKQYRQIGDRIKNMENLKKRIFVVLAKDLKALGKFAEGEKSESEKEYILKIYPGLFQFIQAIDGEIDQYRTILKNKSLWNKKGHPTEIRNIVSAVFAQVIKKAEGEPDWKVIKSLLVWLWEHLKEATYSTELANEIPVFSPATLRSAYFKFMKNPERKSDIEHRATYYFSPHVGKQGNRIEFGKNYITMDTIKDGDIESRYPSIVFPDGAILKGKFDLKEAAAFLKVPPSLLIGMCERGFCPYTKFADQGEITFSRGQLLEIQKWMEKRRSIKSDK